MKTKGMLLFLCVLGHSILHAQWHPEYENPEMFQRGQEEPHASLLPYGSLKDAIRGKRKASSYCQSLNGSWKFQWSPNPDQAPREFYLQEEAPGDWAEIQVPSNWQMKGFGYPLFRNIGLPHPEEPPAVPKEFNPVGSYFRTFRIPASWKGREVFLHFEGVQSASYIWINGEELGYNQGGMEPAEFRISPFLRPGENTLAVRVLRYCDGSYLEDQDTWRLSGIFRDVYLYSTPGIHVRDVFNRTDLDTAYRDAVLYTTLSVKNYSLGPQDSYTLRCRLFDPDRKELRECRTEKLFQSPSKGQVLDMALSIPVRQPARWSAEYPWLYQLVLELADAKGRVLEWQSIPVGFREVEVRDQAVFINGVAVKFNGVNSHMMHPESGHAMDLETMRKDLLLMKQFNINCVRTSHYPPNEEYLELADELGMYIVDETGDEAHAYTRLSFDPLWKEQYLDRMRKMVYRDRNHPSVIIWSAGNESGSGPNICALIEEGKRIDPSRPAWLYGGNRDEDPKRNPITCEDMVGPRYLQPFRLEQRFAKADDPRPSFMDEYIAATGNSLGGLDEYWDLIRRYPRLTGGAIWDWISPGIRMPVKLTPDASGSVLTCALMNRAGLVDGRQGKALYLSGHDDWLEVARDPVLDLEGQALSLYFEVKPGSYNGHAAFLTKGDYQFGVIQPDSLHLEFYLNTGRRQSLRVPLPQNWEGRWHRILAVYDGESMKLYVDNRLAGSHPCRGDIVNAPYPLLLGKSAELRDSHRGYLCHATFDQLRLFDRALTLDELEFGGQELKDEALLWLDFEEVKESGTYYSIGLPGRTYGLVWPDRRVQPELWQLKKSPQPVAFSLLDTSEMIVKIHNYHHFRNLDELDFSWELAADGQFLQRGAFSLELEAGSEGLKKLPLDPAVFPPAEEYHLLVSARLAQDLPWAQAGHEVAWEQFEMKSGSLKTPRPMEASALPVHSENEELLQIKGPDFELLVDKGSGLIRSYRWKGQDLFLSGPRLNVWRAPLANDLDSWSFWQTEMGHVREGMGREPANSWRSTGLDRLEQVLDHFELDTSENQLHVCVEASVHARNYTTGFKVFYDYLLSGEGALTIRTRVSSRGNMSKWIPKIGLQLQLPENLRNYGWFGRGPHENYPDRKTGARVGIWETDVDRDYVPYIIPQDYGNRCDVRWMEVRDQHGSGFRVEGGEHFNFSVQKYSTAQLDRAHYSFQLPDEEGVWLQLDHRVSGVGGTANSVLRPYQLSPGEFNFSFRFIPRETIPQNNNL